MGNLQEEIDKINDGLSKCSIKTRFNNFYIRGRFPDKNGSDTNKQYDISTGLKANLRYIKQASAIAYEIDGDLILQRWDWSKWIRVNTTITEKVYFYVAKFEENYWLSREKTLSRADNFRQDYLIPFQNLPQQENLTTDLLLKYLVDIPPETRKRVRYYNAFRCLLKFAKITPDLPTELKTRYNPSPDRLIPTDAQIVTYHNEINDPAWAWVFGMLATYGLRPHELFFLNCDRLTEEPAILEVLKETKTRDRIVYPLLGSWVHTFRLADVIIPKWKTEEKSNKQLGSIISSWFNNHRELFPITAYHLRDAYAVRGVREGIESSVMARWMGHGLRVHHDHYQKYINENSFTQIWNKSQN
jgi:integrase